MHDLNRRENGNLAVAAVVLFAFVGISVLFRAANAEILLAQDDWVRVPSASSPKKTPATDATGPSGDVVNGSTSSGSVPSQMTVTGTISGLRSGGTPEMELRLRPQPNGFLHGELDIHQSGFGTTPIEGFVRGKHLQFQVPCGSETYYFEGERRNDQISGTFESTPSGERGTWVTQAN